MKHEHTSNDEHEKSPSIKKKNIKEIQIQTEETIKQKGIQTAETIKQDEYTNDTTGSPKKDTKISSNIQADAKKKGNAYSKSASVKKSNAKYVRDNDAKLKISDKFNYSNSQSINKNKKIEHGSKSIHIHNKIKDSNVENKQASHKINFNEEPSQLETKPLPFLEKDKGYKIKKESDKTKKINYNKITNKTDNEQNENKNIALKTKEHDVIVEDLDSINLKDIETSLKDIEENGTNNSITPINGNQNEKAKRNVLILQEIYHKLHKSDDKLKTKLLGKLQSELDRTSDVARIRDAAWEMFDLSSNLVNTIKELKLLYPSPVQVESIPEALLKKNLIVRAKNGTGKTLSFVIPILERSIRESAKNDFALIMVPTRELAMQIGKVVRKIGVRCPIEAISTFGGSSYHEDILRIKKGVGIIVGTPGRIFDLINKNVINIQRFEILALDEADKLLAREYRENIGNIINIFKKENPNKQIMMFSATFPIEISDFTNEYIKDPVELNLMPDLCLKGVGQFFTKVQYIQKLHCLRTLIRMTKYEKCIIFCNSIAAVEKLGYRVSEMSIPCYFFHSRMQLEDRRNIFHQFTSTNDIQVLIATDLITRGIDVPSVNLVINFDFPYSAESFLHRIGRAGRFGRTGCSISMCDEEEIDEMKWIERQTGVEIKGISHPAFDEFKDSNFISK